MPTVRVADYLMARLADEGVKHVFVLPGGGAMHLNDGLACEKRLTPVPCHHEQACGIAAEAWGRVAGSFGVALVTTGPGATNALTPVAGAWIESVPMLVLSGQVKRADRLNGRPLRQGGVQEVDVVAMVRPVTKYAVTVDDPRSIRFHLEKALHEMRSGRSGPVWLDVPLDVQAAPIDPETLEGFTPEAAPEPDFGPQLARVAELLASAERPLILAGHGVRLSGAAAPFLALAERLGVPVVTTWNALDLIPWEHPLCAGRPGVVALRGANFAVQSCDLLLSIGCRLDNIVTAYNPKGFAPAAKRVVVDVDPNEIAKLDMEIEVGLPMDAGRFIAELDRCARPAETPALAAWRDRCADWKRRYDATEGKPFPESGIISHYHFVSALSDAIPPDTLVSTGSSGLAVEAFYATFRNKPGQRVFLTSGLGAMGYGLPAAIGACLADGRRPMVAVESDGSLMLNLQELATLKALDLPMVLVILNNTGYASIRNTQRNYFQARYLATGPEAGLFIPDFVALAESMGIPAMRIDRVEDLQAGLAKALAARGPLLCDVRLVTDEALAPKCSAIPRPDGSIVSMPLEDMSPLLPLEVLRAEMGGRLDPRSIECREGAR